MGTDEVFLVVQSLCPTDNFEDLIGDGCLSCFVIGEFELIPKFCSIVGSLVHGGHTGTVFTGKGISDGFEELHFKGLGQQFVYNGGLRRFLDIIGRRGL